ncbi:hypothetical protein ABHF91_07590 [Pseudaeromonas sp. ZJS20]|uniref:hypothetical protein n=1 Tax=Pseudaeromonas aegiceratis TaxID=3153928 RepID=UPI00390C40B5
MKGRGAVRTVGQPRWAGMLGMVLLGSISTQASAASDDNLIMDVSVGIQHEDNLFRLPDGEDAPKGRADTIVIPRARLGYQQEFSRQTFRVDASAFSPRYQQHDTLDYHGYSLSAAWLGQLGRRWQPQLGYQKSYELSSYEDVESGIMDMLRRQHVNGGLSYGRQGRARVGIDGWLDQKRHGSSTYSQLDLDETGVGVQGHFASRRGAGATLRFESHWIEYQEPLISTLDYRLDKLRLRLNWPISAKMEASADAGYMRWTFDDDSNQSSWLGGAALRWRPTDKLALGLNYNKDSREPGYNLRVAYSEKAGFDASWQPFEKWRLHGTATREWSQFGLSDTTATIRKDVTYVYRTELEWSPFDKFSSQLYWTLGNRNSSQASTEFDYQTIGLLLKYSY